MRGATLKGLAVLVLQLLLLGSVGAKFMLERIQYPRAWLLTVPYDPSLPIRGRYVRLAAVVPIEEPVSDTATLLRVHLDVHEGHVLAIPDENGHERARRTRCAGAPCWVLDEPLAYFIPEHAVDPSRAKPGEALWVEASIPPQGPPRPLGLGRKTPEGLVPLVLD